MDDLSHPAQIARIRAEYETRIRELEAALVKTRADALEEAADLAWSDEDDRPWEHWGEDRNIRTAQIVSKEIAAAIRALKGRADERESVLDQLVADAQEQGMGYNLKGQTDE